MCIMFQSLTPQQVLKMALGIAKAFALCKDSSKIFLLHEFSSGHIPRKTKVGKLDKTSCLKQWRSASPPFTQCIHFLPHQHKHGEANVSRICKISKLSGKKESKCKEVRLGGISFRSSLSEILRLLRSRTEFEQEDTQ